MRSIAESDIKPLTENFTIRENITAGEMISKNSLDKLLENNLLQLMDKRGIIIDGYPRDIAQLQDFEIKVNLNIINLTKFLKYKCTNPS